MLLQIRVTSLLPLLFLVQELLCPFDPAPSLLSILDITGVQAQRPLAKLNSLASSPSAGKKGQYHCSCAAVQLLRLPTGNSQVKPQVHTGAVWPAGGRWPQQTNLETNCGMYS
jgi:hypothetical protein